MRSTLLACRAVGAVAVLVVTPAVGVTAAQAHDAVRVTVTPSAIAPGGEVEIRVDGCDSSDGRATSPAFVTQAGLSGGEGGHSKSPLFGDTRVKSSVKAGNYTIDVRCGGHHHRSGTGTFHVVHGSHHPHAAESPIAPVRAGGGGTAALAAEQRERADESGPGTPHAVVGLVLAGVAAVAVACRSVRRQRAARDSD